MIEEIKQLTYRHVDVFSKTKLSGNGLTVFTNCEGLSTEIMQKITQEMRQYESIFLFKTNDTHRYKARIFTVEEELDFAGHPMLGASAVLHELVKSEASEANWIFDLREKTVPITTIKNENTYFATMDQGEPDFKQPLEKHENHKFLSAFNLVDEDKHETLPLQVVSTGLPYLIIPVKCDLEKVKIVTDHLDQMLDSIGAKFAYVLQVSTLEGRNWANNGVAEDIATGSAAGPAGAYLIKHGLYQPNSEIIIHQGRFLGRPSEIFVNVKGTPNHIHSVEVSGDVCMVAKGTFDDFEI